MRAAGSWLSALAIFAILFLLGFGFVVYAVPGSDLAPLPGSDGRTSSNGVQSSQEDAQTWTALGNSLSYALVPLPVYLHQDAPSNYPFREGGALIVVSGNQLRLTTSFLGSANTAFTNVIQTSGQNITVGMVTTGSSGAGVFKGNVTLASGTYQVGILIFVSGKLSSPVAVSIPRTIQVTLSPTTGGSSSTTSSSTAARSPSSSSTSSSTTTGSRSATSHSSENENAPTNHTTTTQTYTTTTASSPTQNETKGHSWSFKLAAAITADAPGGYRYASSGTAVVTLNSPFSLLDVELGFKDANPSTTYNAVLVLNGTSINLGTMTTNKGGEAELHANTQVGPGRYLLGVMVYDVSDVAAFKAQGPVLVMVSDPKTQLAVIVPPNTEHGSSSTTTNSAGGPESEGSSTQSSLSSLVTRSATTISAGGQVQGEIQRAVENLIIPATVQVTPLLSSTSVLDSRFSLSVGQQVGNGLVIAISGENVTGPRVLLVNMSKTAPLALYPALNVTLDGMPVTEASSALQVLNPSSSDPPRYVLVATANSIQLLVSIPHFSLHLIQVAGVIVQSIQTALEVDAPLLAGSILVITLAFAGAYAARKRYFSIL